MQVSAGTLLCSASERLEKGFLWGRIIKVFICYIPCAYLTIILVTHLTSS